MNPNDLSTLVDRLRALPTETEWLEFKRNNTDPQQIGEYLSALANEAGLCNQPRGYLVFGIDDATHDVVGTSFDPYAAKAKGNQGLLPWLGALLEPNPGIDVHLVDHPDGRVVMLAVGPARDRPCTFAGVAYCRVGNSKTELVKHPAKERALWTRGSDWSAETCHRATLADLNPEAIAKAREQFLVKHPSQSGELAQWDDLTFLNKARLLKQGEVTNAALVLLGRAESATLLTPAVAKVSWLLKDAENRELDYEHFAPPFLLVGDRLLKRLRNLTVRALPSGTLFPQELTQYDPWVIREALHNSIAHQDYRRHARIAVVEFPDRVLITNIGEFLPGSVQTVIEQDAPQLLYRNPFLADAMVELNLIDTQGGGIKRMFETQRRRSFPLPDYDLDQPGQVSVSIPGQILDERYTRLLMEQSSLSLPQVLLLDRIQKGRRITREDHKRLKSAGLVEGRYPSVMVSGTMAKATGDVARHIRERGFDKQWYLDMILALIQEHGPVARQHVDELLLPKLPDRMSDVQKRRKVHNLLQELRNAEKIVNQGTRTKSKWVSKKPISTAPKRA
ncbi:RNA-binding domain-containing protein [Gemmatimonas groenlandica]|uniref:Transcriptional regulator n=1 Tax=Gemmatimonas groenlandica TaxID=2732249 RepID=A0A6M4IWF7_9BACT|nr:RNA-binding domain-containing protein [Gemmatimonas groenlandica]QJR36521.1 transcriptional regulator [Gemmatimonas groenlandica]